MMTLLDRKVQRMFCVKCIFQCQKMCLKWTKTEKSFYKTLKKIMAIVTAQHLQLCIIHHVYISKR